MWFGLTERGAINISVHQHGGAHKQVTIHKSDIMNTILNHLTSWPLFSVIGKITRKSKISRQASMVISYIKARGSTYPCSNTGNPGNQAGALSHQPGHLTHS